MESISTIAISRSSRDMLKRLGNKGQTYDELIQDLVELKRRKKQDSPDREVGSLQSGESKSPSELVNSMSQVNRPIQINKNLCDCNGCNRDATTEIEVNVGELGIIRLSRIPKFKRKPDYRAGIRK